MVDPVRARERWRQRGCPVGTAEGARFGENPCNRLHRGIEALRGPETFSGSWEMSD